MSIKLKILIPMLLITIISGAIILVSNISQFSGYVDTNTDNTIKTAAEVSSNEVDNLKSLAGVISLYMAQDPAIIESLANGDRDSLLSRSQYLQTATGVGFCTIADASGTAIARPHNPQSYGDDVTGMPSVRSALSGEALTVIEEGVSVRMSVCSGAPVFDAHGELLGVVCVGFRLDTDEFVDSMKKLTNCEVTVFLKDERISTTVVKNDGTRAVGTKAASNVSEIVLNGNIYKGHAKILERDTYTEYTPVTGVDGQVLGMLFVGQYMDESSAVVSGFVKIGLLVLFSLLTIAFLVIIYITKHLVAPIGIMVDAANALAVGDLDVNVQVNTKDEILKLANAFNGMIENTQKQTKIIEAVADGDLSVMIEPRSEKDVVNNAIKLMLERNNDAFSQIVSSAEQVSTGAKQIASGSQILAQGATEQAASTEEFSAALSELQMKIQKTAENSVNAQNLDKQSGRKIEESIRYMGEMLEAMQGIDEGSKNITKVIKVIDDIAFQTNILALNAAVEAARAGSHGKGFAVVADEVRNLASKSAEAARETAALIDGSAQKVQEGNQIVKKTNSSLEAVVSGAKEAAVLLHEVVVDSTAQAKAIQEMAQSIEQISGVIQENSASAEESAAASEEMSAQATMLKGIVSSYKLKSPDNDQTDMRYIGHEKDGIS